MEVAYQGESNRTKRSQRHLETDKRVSIMNIYQRTRGLDYDIISERYKQPNKINPGSLLILH